ADTAEPPRGAVGRGALRRRGGLSGVGDVRVAAAAVPVTAARREGQTRGGTLGLLVAGRDLVPRHDLAVAVGLDRGEGDLVLLGQRPDGQDELLELSRPDLHVRL